MHLFNGQKLSNVLAFTILLLQKIVSRHTMWTEYYVRYVCVLPHLRHFRTHCTGPLKKVNVHNGIKDGIKEVVHVFYEHYIHFAPSRCNLCNCFTSII